MLDVLTIGSLGSDLNCYFRSVWFNPYPAYHDYYALHTTVQFRSRNSVKNQNYLKFCDLTGSSTLTTLR